MEKCKQNIYQEKIIHILGCIPKVQSKYNIFNSRTLEIHPNDFLYFDKLFNETINSNYGSGELALYWLLGEDGIEFDRKHKNDLILNGISVEIKKYTKHKLIKIGKIPVSLNGELVKIQKILTSIDENHLVSNLNKTLIQQLTPNPELEVLFISLIKGTLSSKLGEKGYIINFKSSEKADIYMLDISLLDYKQMLNYVSFNEGYLHLELENIFVNEETP